MDQDIRELERAALADPHDPGAFERYARGLERVGDRWRRLAGLSALGRAGSPGASALIHARQKSPPGPPRGVRQASFPMRPIRTVAGSDYVCVLAEDHHETTHLLCVDAELTERWRRPATRGVAVECIEDRVLVLTGSELTLLDATSGGVVDTIPAVGPTIAALAGDQLLLCAAPGRVERVHVTRARLTRCDGWEARGAVQSLGAYGGTALVTTVGGVAAHALETGVEAWWRSTAPRSGREVYRVVRLVDHTTVVVEAWRPKNERVEVCDATTGEVLWDATLRDAHLVLPVDAERLACMTGSRLVLRSRATGEKLASHPCACEAANSSGGVLLGLDRKGRDAIVATRVDDGARLWRHELPFEQGIQEVEVEILDNAVLVVATPWKDHRRECYVARLAT